MKILILFGLAAVAAAAPSPEEGELCWEKCFRGTYGTEVNRFRDIYQDILDIVLDIKTVMNLNNLTKVGYVIDSSISKWHDPAFNPDVLNSGLPLHTSDYIFFFEYMLGIMLNYVIDNAPYLVQFDEISAWGCRDPQCTQNCYMSRGFRWMTPIVTRPSSHCPNNMEAACNLLGSYMTNLTCARANYPGEKGLLVAIVNSDFTSLMNPLEDDDPICPKYPSSSHRQISACKTYFDHRYVIGIHEASERVIQKFVSSPKNYRMLPQNLFTYQAVKSAYLCINPASNRPCCNSQPIALVNLTKCDRTEGFFGESLVDYPTYPGLGLAVNQKYVPTIL